MQRLGVRLEQVRGGGGGRLVFLAAVIGAKITNTTTSLLFGSRRGALHPLQEMLAVVVVHIAVALADAQLRLHPHLHLGTPRGDSFTLQPSRPARTNGYRLLVQPARMPMADPAGVHCWSPACAPHPEGA